MPLGSSPRPLRRPNTPAAAAIAGSPAGRIATLNLRRRKHHERRGRVASFPVLNGWRDLGLTQAPPGSLFSPTSTQASCHHDLFGERLAVRQVERPAFALRCCWKGRIGHSGQDRRPCSFRTRCRSLFDAPSEERASSTLPRIRLKPAGLRFAFRIWATAFSCTSCLSFQSRFERYTARLWMRALRFAHCCPRSNLSRSDFRQDGFLCFLAPLQPGGRRNSLLQARASINRPRCHPGDNRVARGAAVRSPEAIGMPEAAGVRATISTFFRHQTCRR